MWHTFLTTLTVSMREKSNLLWLFFFPLLMASLFWGMFGGLTKTTITPVNFAIVNDSNWHSLSSADTLLSTISGKNHHGITLIKPTVVKSVRQAVRRVNAGSDSGYLYVTSTGNIAVTISQSMYSDAANSGMSSSTSGIVLSSLRSVITQFNLTSASINDLAHAQQRSTIAKYVQSSVSSAGLSYTRDRDLTHFTPDQFARYYYALLGMVCMMSMSFAISSITMAQANLSPLGARRSVSPLPKWRQYAAIMLASWLTSYASLLVSFCYIRFVCNIAVGGREVLALCSLLVASFTATTLGLLIGTIPRLSLGAKTAISTSIACIGALFAGLYGSFAMDISDSISRNMPTLNLLNPVKQVANLFYDLLYYDSLQPFLRTTGLLLSIGIVSMGLSIMMMRRRGYANL